jgi:hypothetical protein
MGLRLELLARARRDVHLLAGVFLVFCGTVLAWTAADMALDYRSALELRGVVIAKERVRADADEKGTRFVARYRFALPGGETRDTEEDLPRQVWEARAIGSEHGILYLPAQGRALPTAGAEQAGAAIMGAIGLVLLVGGALLARSPARALLERLRLVGSGVRAAAVVADLYQTSTAVNRVILWRLRYRYRSPGGSEHEGESELLTPAEAGAWQVGSEGEILLDPERSASSVWLGRAPGAAGTASPAAGVRPGAALRKAGRWVLNLALFFAALFVAAVAAELVPELRSAEDWMQARRDELLMVTIGASLAGIFLLLGAVIVMLMQGGEPMDHTGVENQQRSMRDARALPYASRASTYRLFGKGAGASAHDAFSFAEAKRALASGTALRDPLWRRRACAAAGGLLIFLGVFGLMIVVTPLALKLLLAAVVLYALARVAWAALRA